MLSTGASRGARRRAYERALPIAEARDAILAYDMNGAPLPPQHGFPLRLVVPGWYGMQNVKWLTRITVLEEPFSGFQNSVAYRMYDADGEPGEPVTRMLPRSLMVPPGVPDFMTRTRHVEPGPTTLTGRAWSGHGRIDRRRGVNRRRRNLRCRRPGPGARPDTPGAAGASSGTRPRASTCFSSRATRRRRQHPAARPALEPEGLREQRGGEDHRAGRALDCPPRAHLQRHPADRAQAPRQLHRGDPRLSRGPGARRPGDLLHRRPARHERLVRPEGAARLRARHDGDADGRRARPGALHPVSPVRRGRALGAVLAALVGHALRRSPAHDPVQGQVGARAAAGPDQPVPLPGAPGGRHPALQGRPGAGGRGPAPAPRAGARDRAALQLDLRRGVRRARGRDPEDRSADHGPPEPRHEDVDHRRHGGRARSTSTTSPTRS